MKSTLYSCTSCQHYLQALQEMALLDKKTINIKFIANENTKTTEDLLKIIE